VLKVVFAVETGSHPVDLGRDGWGGVFQGETGPGFADGERTWLRRLNKPQDVPAGQERKKSPEREGRGADPEEQEVVTC